MLKPLQERRSALHAPMQSPLQATDSVDAAEKNKRTFAGGCHCGAVRFEVDIAPAAQTRKCNCSFCTKTRFWKTFASTADFRLLAGADCLTDYQFGEGNVHHYFCSRCGVRPFARTETGDAGNDLYAINIACLEGANVDMLRTAPVRYEDGRNDDWWAVPAETQQL